MPPRTAIARPVVNAPAATPTLEAALQEFEQLENDIFNDEEALKRKKANLKYLGEEVITDLVELHHLRDGAKLSDGRVVTFYSDIKASVKSEFKDAAHQYLQEHGHGNILRRSIIVSCGKDADEKTQTLMNVIKLMLNQVTGVEVEVKTELPGATMSAWVRARLNAGAEVPPMFGLFNPMRATYTSATEPAL